MTEKGWKLSHYITYTVMDFNDERQLETAIEIMRRVHDISVGEEMRFDFRKEIQRVNRLLDSISDAYSGFQKELQHTVFRLLDLVEEDQWSLCLTHDDINWGNFLMHDDCCDLIDWEYAGLNDKAYDIAKLVLKAEAVGEDARQIISK